MPAMAAMQAADSSADRYDFCGDLTAPSATPLVVLASADPASMRRSCGVVQGKRWPSLGVLVMDNSPGSGRSLLNMRQGPFAKVLSALQRLQRERVSIDNG